MNTIIENFLNVTNGTLVEEVTAVVALLLIVVSFDIFTNTIFSLFKVRERKK